jgi:hypothetical protein
MQTENDDDGLDAALAVFGKKRELIVVRLREYKGHRLLDVRRWYRKNGTEWAPTSKGIALNRDGFEFLARVFETEETRIQSYFSGEDDTHLRVRDEHESQRQSYKEAAYSARPYDIGAEEWSGPSFFRLDGMGAKDRLVLNSKHPVGKALLARGLDETLKHLLVSFGRACRLVDGGVEGEMSDQLDLLQANWAFILREYIGERKS